MRLLIGLGALFALYSFGALLISLLFIMAKIDRNNKEGEK